MANYGSAWTMFFVRGLCAIAFGLIALINPDKTLQALFLLFGVFIVVDALVAYVGSRGAADRPEMRRSLILDAFVGLAIGIVVLFLTAIAAFVLLFLCGLWAIVSGGIALSASVALLKSGIGDWLLVIKSAALLIFGVLLAFFPVESVAAIVWLFGAFAVVYGAMQIALAMRYHGPGPNRGIWHAG